MKDTRCTASVFIEDDRWGDHVDHCSCVAGHDGPHMAARNACQPQAWLSWLGSYADAEAAS